MMLCFSHCEMFETRIFFSDIFAISEYHLCEPRAQLLGTAEPGAKVYCIAECMAYDCASAQFGQWVFVLHLSNVCCI